MLLQQVCSVGSSVEHAHRSLLRMRNNAMSSSNKGTYLNVLNALDSKTSLAYHGANTEERSQQYAKRWRLGLSQPHTGRSASLPVSYSCAVQRIKSVLYIISLNMILHTLYRPDYARLDTRRLYNTTLLHPKSNEKKIRRKKKKCRTRQCKRDSRSSNIPE